MNSSPPVSAARANAPQVHGSVSLASCETRRAWPFTPTSRRSTSPIVPITVTSAKTWMVSMVGNIQVDSAIVVPSDEYSIRSQILVGSGYIYAPSDRRVGDPATAPHDQQPQDDEQQRGRPDTSAGHLGLAREVPGEQDGDENAHHHEDHLDPEVGIHELADR